MKDQKMPLLSPIQIASLTSRIMAKSLGAGATSSLLQQAAVATAAKVQAPQITAFVEKSTSESISKNKNNFSSLLKEQLSADTDSDEKKYEVQIISTLEYIHKKYN